MANNYYFMRPSETNHPCLTVTFSHGSLNLGSVYAFRFITLRTKSIIFGIHLIQHHVMSVHDPHLVRPILHGPGILPYISGSIYR